jgi:hypothetical protein
LAIYVTLGVDTVQQTGNKTAPYYSPLDLVTFLSVHLAAAAFFPIAVSGSRARVTCKLGCSDYLFSPAQLSEMWYIPRGLRVDLGQGGAVTWVKDEVQGAHVVTQQDVGHAESILDQTIPLPITVNDGSTQNNRSYL